MAPADSSPKAVAFERQSDVLGHCEIGEERGLLIDHGNAERFSGMRVVVVERNAVEMNGSRIRLHGAGQNFDEG